MPRYVLITNGCDWADCEATAPEDSDVVTPLTLALDGKSGKTFLLCKEHREQLLDEILLPLMQKGVKAEPAPKAPAKRGTPRSTPAPVPGTPEADSLVCKVEDCNRHGRPLHNRTGLAQHVIKTHGFENLAAYESQFGPVSNARPEPSTTS